MTLRTKTSLLLTALIIVIFTGAGFFALQFLETSLRKSIYGGLESISNTSSQSISKFLDETLKDTQMIASFFPEKTLEEKNVAVIERYLKTLLEVHPKFENGIFLLDAKGTLWADYPVYPETRGKNFAHREYFKTTMEKQKRIIGVPYQSARTGEAVLTFTALLKGSKNQVQGMIGCSVQLLHSNALDGIRKTKIGESGYIYVVDTSRLMILHPEDKRVLQRDFPLGANKLLDSAIEGFEGVGETVNSRGVPMLLSLKHIPGTHWIVGAQQPKSEAFAPIEEARTRIIWWIFGAVLVSISIGAIAVRRLTEPLVKLRNMAIQLGQNIVSQKEGSQKKEDFREEFKEITSSDEIGDLAHAFKEMSSKLDQTFISLKFALRDWERTFDSVQDPIFILDKENRILRINHSALKLIGLSPEKILGQPCCRLMHGTEVPPFTCPHQQTLVTGKPAQVEIEEPFLKGYYEITTTPVFDEAGQITGTVHVMRDITERKRVEEAVRMSEERYRTLAEAAREMIFIIDREGVVKYVNQFAANSLQSLPDQIIGKPLDQLFSGEISKRQKANLRRVFESGEPFYTENITPFRDGEKWLGTQLVPMKNKSREVDAVLGISRDITDRKRMEEAFRVSEEKYRSLVDHAIDAIYIAQDGMVKFPNPSTLALTGYSEEDYATIPFVNFIHPEDRDMVVQRHNQRLRGEEVPSPYSFRIISKAGEERWVHLNAVLTEWEKRPAILCFMRDITSHKKLEAQYQHAQKMEAVGTLAGGIAHDFNNLLQSVLGYTEILLMNDQMRQNASKDLEEIKRAAKRGAELTQQLLTFSRKVQSKLRPIDLNQEVVQVQKILQRTLPKMINVEISLKGDLKPINADPTQIEQVLMNLAVNARDAMPEGGRLTIKTDNVTLDDAFCKTHLESKPGEYVELTVSDTGHGMDEEILKNIFDPFFTTKGVGKGPGLGLAMVYGIVKNHDGNILCESKLDQGTAFKTYFPAAEQERAVETLKEDQEVRGGSETILLVDDEEPIRNLGLQIFRNYGYRVFQAPDGENALRLYQDKKDEIDLVVLDLIMPIMGGKKCLEELLRIDPKVRVVIASGYSPEGTVKEILEKGAKNFIHKPFNMKEMLQVVRKVLDESSHS
jgi:PAS domain S-box-containing protein